jgi:hypothetical protein
MGYFSANALYKGGDYASESGVDSPEDKVAVGLGITFAEAAIPASFRCVFIRGVGKLLNKERTDGCAPCKTKYDESYRVPDPSLTIELETHLDLPPLTTNMFHPSMMERGK